MHVNGNNVTYFDSFEAEYILKEIRNFIGNKNIKTNIYRIQANDSIMTVYFFIGFIDFVLKGKRFLDDTNVFFPKKYERNHKIVLKYFQYLKKLFYG